jgi:hypothetical protein
LALAGCDDGRAITLPVRTAKPKVVVQRKVGEPPADPARSRRGGASPPASKLQKELDVIAKAYDASRAAARSMGQPEELAVRKIASALRSSVEVGPTLVVWLLDRTPSAQTLVTGASQAISGYYDSAEVRQWSLAENQPLQTAVVTFEEQVTFALDPPAVDWRQVQAAIAGVQHSSSGRENTFGAIRQVLEKYLPLRTAQQRELVIVVVTDEAGDDPQAVDDALALARRNAIPIYVLGFSAPWGQTNPFAPNPKAIDISKTDDSLPIVGPESVQSERVDIVGWSAGYSAQTALELVDSGFGPQALERLCRGSRGQFLAMRPPAGSASYSYRGTTYRYWPPGGELRFEDAVVSKYAPDYVSAADYQKLVGENKAKAALVAAAKMPKVVVEGYPESQFPKGTEAQMARKLSQAQQFAAKNSPPVDQLYAVLAAGEGDRESLTGLRWQAQFDLAMGRVSAIKARLDGYNSMIAALKRGRNFQNAGSTQWTLEPADAFETESTIKKLAERAKAYLERVVKDHPGTPWARIAEEELKNPLGWTWRES